MNYHPASNLFPLMTGADFDALTADIAEHGQREPIWLHPDGSILDGRNRWRACEVLGIAPLVCTWDGEPGEEEAFVVSLNLHRRHLDRDQRAEVMRSLRAGGMTYQKIADTLGVDTATAYRATRDVNLQTQIENERGQARPPAYERKREAESELEPAPTPTNGRAAMPHVAQNSGNNEWYTPQEYIEAARRVMGAIDLDPASSAIANERIGASQFYAIEDDGLALPWRGRVWMNPPYAAELIGRFCARLAHSYAAGHVDQAVVLVNNATETIWFRLLAEQATAFCFPAGRIRFWSPDGTPGAPLQGQAFVYLGRHVTSFASEFSRFGIVLCPYSKTN